MNNVKTIEELSNSINNDFKKNSYDDVEKLAYMIMTIAKERSFSSEYHWSDEENKKKIVRDLFLHERINDFNNQQLICVTAARILQQIAIRFDIKLSFLGNNSGRLTEHSFDNFLDYEHIIPVYRISDDYYISVDLERNLDNIQTGKKWRNFGQNCYKHKKSILAELPEDRITSVMKKIGYINNENDYLDYYIDNIFKEHKNDRISKKLDVLLKNQNLSQCSSRLRSSADIFRFYKKIIREYVCNDNSISLPFGGQVLNSDDAERFITGVYYSNQGIERFWLWSNTQNEMVEVTRKYLESVINTCNIKIYSGNDFVDAEKTLNLDNKNNVKPNNYNQFLIK